MLFLLPACGWVVVGPRGVRVLVPLALKKRSKAALHLKEGNLELGRLLDEALELKADHPNDAASLADDIESAYDAAISTAWDEVEASWDLLDHGAMVD